ncbi:S8 family peptidase [Algoriphagus pacificus]|uniref:S8 family peptidase n=1 Tax=Algoriphagus pacificus TaxID=2811234 RepID=A0ABS3CAT1_9BACT|nr:S8 family peptidase [Algoriphagus pacificus]MBN7814212.1 S8 family peptidase [Algoriphagus pacificus]
MADKKPLLIFPTPGVASREPRPLGRPNLTFPDYERQKQRIGRRWQTLKENFERESLSLSLNPEGFFTEYIVVFELAGSIEEFYTAIAKIPGMFFLKELLEEFEPDEDFYKDDHQPYPGRVYVSMVNKRSIQEILRLWKIFDKDRETSFDTGLTKFKNLFSQLRDVRPYSVEDRFKDTGMDHYLEEIRGLGQERVRFEIEFAYPEGQERRDRAVQEVQKLISEAGGEIVSGSELDLRAIRYLACLADAPISVFENLTSSSQIRFLKASHVLFFRPPGQAIASQGPIETLELQGVPPGSEAYGDPMVAVFDGLPLENHELLQGRIIVDDPDDFTAKYIAGSRIHGTAVASTICHGDLNGERQSLVRPVYSRPVMHYNGLTRREEFPEDRLVIDVLHRAIIRMVRGTREELPVANRVKVVNISLGDGFRPYRRELSTWAMFLDWAAFEYNLLFIVSAGNFGEDIKFTIEPAAFRNPISEEARKTFLKEMIGQDFNRKILSPAESINALTVGALNRDEAEIDIANPMFFSRININEEHGYLAPYSRFGWGHNGSVKPDILMPGGRALLRRKLADRSVDHVNLSFEPGGFPHPPGVLVASPGSAGQLNHMTYLFGTTFSAAQTTHLAAKLIEVLIELNQEAPAAQQIDEEYFPVLIKALIAHGANLAESYELFRSVILNSSPINPNQVKARMSAFTGYGAVNGQRVLYCTTHRVTLIGIGQLCSKEGENASLFRFPLPTSISSQVVQKTLTATLAWFSPCNVWSNKYRQAHLYLSNLGNNKDLSFDDGTYDFRKSSKGTLQHQIFSGNRADVFIEGGFLTIKVNCRMDASGLENWKKIRYGLAVTLEIPETVEVDIYEEIKAAIQTQVRT